MDKLLSILSHRREHNSTGELSFALKFLSHCEPLYDLNNEVIAYRFDNTHPEDRSRVLFSCHIDTMHRKEPERVFQEVFVDSLTNQVFVNSSDDCLGADDGAGVYLLLEMIERDVHGCFLFHRGEEKGGIGSRAMSSIYADWLKTFTHAIAFDRRGARSVITHQGMNRGASDKCAQFIIDLFGMNHELDDTGTYTDTREYFGLIPECFNFSIGYDHEHSSREILDLDYLMKLKDKIKKEEAYIQIRIKRESPFEYEEMQCAIMLVIIDKANKTKYAVSQNGLSEVFDGEQIPVACRFNIPNDLINTIGLTDKIEVALYNYGIIKSNKLKITRSKGRIK